MNGQLQEANQSVLKAADDERARFSSLTDLNDSAEAKLGVHKGRILALQAKLQEQRTQFESEKDESLHKLREKNKVAIGKARKSERVEKQRAIDAETEAKYRMGKLNEKTQLLQKVTAVKQALELQIQHSKRHALEQLTDIKRRFNTLQCRASNTDMKYKLAMESLTQLRPVLLQSNGLFGQYTLEITRLQKVISDVSISTVGTSTLITNEPLDWATILDTIGAALEINGCVLKMYIGTIWSQNVCMCFVYIIALCAFTHSGQSQFRHSYLPEVKSSRAPRRRCYSHGYIQPVWLRPLQSRPSFAEPLYRRVPWSLLTQSLRTQQAYYRTPTFP